MRTGSLAAVVLTATLGLAPLIAAREDDQGAAQPFDVAEASIAQLQEAMRAGRVTSRQLVEAHLARIAAYDRSGPRLNAMSVLNPQALAAADALDRERAAGRVRGPLHGVPVVVKDNFETVEMPTAAGSIALATFHPKSDAFQVARLREAGAVILGKTAMHELASGITTISSATGQTKNPYDLTRNPGGSSGGTGAAVAAGFAAAGLGSDTCGSIRIPASHNNLVGLRGTRGLSSRTGIVPLSSTQDIGGPLARTLADLAVVLDATVAPDPADPTTDAVKSRMPPRFTESLRRGRMKGVRIGVLKSLFGADDEEGSAVVRKAVEAMTKLGAEAVDVAVPGLDDLLRDSSVINSEFKFDFAEYLVSRPGSPVATLADILEHGLYSASLEANLRRRAGMERRDTDAYRRALIKRDSLRRAVIASMDEHDVAALVHPTMRRAPARIGEPQPGSTCQLSASSGLPALSVPAGFTDDGLPIGVEFLGREFSEADLLAIAFDFEQSEARRRPPFSAPPLAAGKPPGPLTFDVVEGEGGADVRIRFSFDPLTSTLTFDARLKEEVLLVGLHRGGPDANGALLFRLVEPGATTGSGVLTLNAPAREDLYAGKLYVQGYTRARPTGAWRAAIRMRR
jgi:Asp-tRNA(Asn)/Glu-tRNA(Gln) amidotransferase A subunit family amidase